MVFKKAITFYLIMCSGLLLAQSVGKPDTLQMARSLSYNKDYTGALNLLKAFEIKHPNDINVLRVHAQLLYWQGEYSQADDFYRNAIKDNPKQNSIQLDYGRMLFNIKKGDRAKPVLLKYLQTDSTNIETISMLGTIAYWQNNPVKALKYFKAILEKYPTNEWALEYVKKIHQDESPYVIVGSEYTGDTQPMVVLASTIKAGCSVSPWLSPSVAITNQLITAYVLPPLTDLGPVDDQRNFSVWSEQFANKFSMADVRMDITMGFGNAGYPDDDQKPTWLFSLNKKLFKNFTFSALADHKPYLNTTSSVFTDITQTNFGASLNYNKPNSFSGQLGYNDQMITSSDYVQSYYVWLLSPPLKFSKFVAHIGYSFNYANSSENNYLSTELLAYIVGDYSPTEVIPGSYQPNFTPINQQIHSVIVNITFKPIKPLNFNFNGNYGFYAVGNNPYLYLDKNGEGLFVNHGYSQVHFTPMQMTGTMNCSISAKVMLSVYYTYTQAFYYNSNMAGLKLKFNFWNGK